MRIYLSDFCAKADGKTNCADAFIKCFEKAKAQAEPVIVIEEGTYLIDSQTPIPLCSDLHIFAYGAKFLFPENLGQNRKRVMFEGTDIKNFTWSGGHFEGYVYNPEAKDNLWEPSDYTGGISIKTTDGGMCENIKFCGITSKNVAGAIVHVEGNDANFAKSIDIRDCHFENTGKFMWDYGYLWQRVVFESEYSAESVKNAFEYIPKEHISSELSLIDGKIVADFMPKALPEERDAVTFFGSEMPKGIKRGKQYFVVNKGAQNDLLISETEGGEPLTLEDMPKGTRLFRNMFFIFHDLYFPIGCTSAEKGSIDTVKCKDVTITGCRINASGDSMHIAACHNVIFSANQITGSRMGAFYIGAFCKNVTAVGNTVNGTNGSRTVSVECGSEDVVLCGNTFIGGGRGNWINQPKNIIISNNIFIRNTNKCKKDIKTGRICQATGDFESYPELYFTTCEKDATYGPVVVKGNTFETDEGASAAIAFNPKGHDIVFEGNIIKGDVHNIHIADGCEEPVMSGNIGVGEILDRVFVNTANVR